MKIDQSIIQKEGVQAYYNRFILIFLKILRLNDIKTEEGKYYSKTYFLRFLREQDDDLFKFTYRFFARAILRIETGKPIIKHFKYVIFVVLSRLFNFQIDLKSDGFMQGMTISTPKDEKVLVKENTYIFHDLNIELDRVHGVKGQTHTATLYLETVYHSKTVESIIEYITGGSKEKLEAYEEKHLKVAYVAMTRPTDLLCISMDEEVYLKNLEQLSTLGWVHYTEALSIQ
ncbi:hypothetical protein [Paenibacillus donghaensis]|uniref:Uncharacterized protein n=1 Tax=Paenibacillus donghaensis TaxID=414771 RepID=A0A2Z2K5G0_9BACL|nr:hypothetical protein [Paenibacillus donghaensis]ASA19807.1 hypothetical protein B9T62_02675 [Paenibacillus donghaensis]